MLALGSVGRFGGRQTLTISSPLNVHAAARRRRANKYAASRSFGNMYCEEVAFLVSRPTAAIGSAGEDEDSRPVDENKSGSEDRFGGTLMRQGCYHFCWTHNHKSAFKPTCMSFPRDFRGGPSVPRVVAGAYHLTRVTSPQRDDGAGQFHSRCDQPTKGRND